MKVEYLVTAYAIRRGRAYFAFFIDDDRSSWSSLGGWRMYSSREEAESDMREIRRRDSLRARQRLPVGGK